MDGKNGRVNKLHQGIILRHVILLSSGSTYSQRKAQLQSKVPAKNIPGPLGEGDEVSEDRRHSELILVGLQEDGKEKRAATRGTKVNENNPR